MQFTDPQAALNHAMLMHQQERYAEAESLYRQLQINFGHEPSLIHLIGLLEVDTGRKAQGFANMRRAIELQPNVPHFHSNLGVRLLQNHEASAAEVCLLKAIALQPDNDSNHYNMGNVLMGLRRWEDALAAYNHTLKLNPNHAQADIQIGLVLQALERHDDAVAHYRQALARRPGDLAMATNLGAIYQDMCELDLARDAFREAVASHPTNPTPLNNLGIIHKEIGDVSEAVQVFRRCLEINPKIDEIRSNLILTLHYDPDATAEIIAEEHAKWNRLHPPVLTAPTRPIDPDKRLRIGFVSPDLRDHVVGRALFPVFSRLNPANFERYCYSMVAGGNLNSEFQRLSTGWRDTLNRSAEQIAEMIRKDQIDILIDLSLHTSYNRIDVFTLKPAPIQVSWLGYPESSGSAAMDYRITDSFLEPPEGNRVAAPNERAWCLADCWTCYEPPQNAPMPNLAPFTQGRPFTFGSLNNTCKINNQVLDAWARILNGIPSSQLKLLAKQGSHRRRIIEAFRQRGINPDCIQFFDYQASSNDLDQSSFLYRYHEIDLALDTFPYGGMTTTLDSLWMGVPVISLIGTRNLGRAGLSILNTIGLKEFAAHDVDAYVALALRTAQTPERLTELRAELRTRMQSSPLTDADGFSRKIEAAFRGMWHEWCRNQR